MTTRYLLLFPPIAGEIFFYQNLAGHVKEHFNVVVVESLGLEKNKEFDSLRSMTTNYYEEFKYLLNKYDEIHLCGWSFGGLLCLDFADKMLDEKLFFKSVHVIDTYSPIRLRQKDEKKEIQTLLNIANDLGGLFKIEVPLTEEDFLSHPRDARLNLILNYLKERCYGKFSERKKKEFKSNLWNMYHHIPNRYDFTFHFYQSSEDVPGNTYRSRDGWEKWTNSSSINTIKVAGNHYSLLSKENSPELANQIIKNSKNDAFC